MFTIPTDAIQNGVLYQVVGEASVLYNDITYATGSYFRGVSDTNAFEYSGSGTQELYEVLELSGSTIEFAENTIDAPVYSETTILFGASIEFALNNAEKIVNEITKIQGFAIEFSDFPYFSFEITETRG